MQEVAQQEKPFDASGKTEFWISATMLLVGYGLYHRAIEQYLILPEFRYSEPSIFLAALKSPKSALALLLPIALVFSRFRHLSWDQFGESTRATLFHLLFDNGSRILRCRLRF